MTLKSILLILAIGIASNLDNAGIGISYGVRKIRISLIPNFMIALMGFLLALLGGLFGNLISLWLTPFICQFISMIVLVSIGVYVLGQQYLANHKPEAVFVFNQPHPKKEALEEGPAENVFFRILRCPEEADWDNSKSIGLTESIILGIALSLNNLAGGFSAGVTNLNILATALVSGLFSFLFISLCASFGLKFAAGRLGEKATIISGIMLILVGLRQIIH